MIAKYYREVIELKVVIQIVIIVYQATVVVSSVAIGDIRQTAVVKQVYTQM